MPAGQNALSSALYILKTRMLNFTTTEADLLGRTADALCAYMGKPVLAEIVAETDAGFEWVLFAIPLTPDQDDDLPRVQLGGPGSRLLGSCGGLDLSDDEPLDCEFLWAIQLCDLENIRYIKVDANGDETAWTDRLEELLPFDLREVSPPDDDMDAEQGNSAGTPGKP